jgi:hypothetical protein
MWELGVRRPARSQSRELVGVLNYYTQMVYAFNSMHGILPLIGISVAGLEGREEFGGRPGQRPRRSYRSRTNV